ncbi:MAG: hypothetical protein H8K04_08960 [Nitrospira sp.]
MWLLLIVLLTPTAGVSPATVLNTFATYEDCQPERNRIGFEMAESYPYESDFRIVCEFRAHSKTLTHHIDQGNSAIDHIFHVQLSIPHAPFSVTPRTDFPFRSS